jgi:hypothetical protein
LRALPLRRGSTLQLLETELHVLDQLVEFGLDLAEFELQLLGASRLIAGLSLEQRETLVDLTGEAFRRDGRSRRGGRALGRGDLGRGDLRRCALGRRRAAAGGKAALQHIDIALQPHDLVGEAAAVLGVRIADTQDTRR